MNTPNWKISGAASFEVAHADGAITVHDQNNMVLDNFYTWLLSAGNIQSLTPSCKVGTGSSPSAAGMTALEAPVTLASGSWPISLAQTGNLSYVKNGGSVVAATIEFKLVFGLGQFNGNISEAGLDFTGVVTASSPLVQTRIVITDVNGNPATVAVKNTDQLTVTYRMTIEASVYVPDVTIPVNIDGTAVDHVFKFNWGPPRKFVVYLNSVGGYISYTNNPAAFLVANVETFPAPFASQNVYGTSSGPTSQFTDAGDSLVCTYKFGSAQGNIDGGFNYLAAAAASGEWYRYQIIPHIQKVAGQEFEFTLTRKKRDSVLSPPLPEPGADTPDTGREWSTTNNIVGDGVILAVRANDELELCFAAQQGIDVGLATHENNVWTAPGRYFAINIGFGMYANFDMHVEDITERYNLVMELTHNGVTKTAKMFKVMDETGHEWGYWQYEISPGVFTQNGLIYGWTGASMSYDVTDTDHNTMAEMTFGSFDIAGLDGLEETEGTPVELMPFIMKLFYQNEAAYPFDINNATLQFRMRAVPIDPTKATVQYTTTLVLTA